MGRAGNEEGGTEKEGEEEESRGGRDGEEDREKEGWERESQMPEGVTGPMDLMDLRLSGTTDLPLGGGVRSEEKGEGSLTACHAGPYVLSSLGMG